MSQKHQKCPVCFPNTSYTSKRLTFTSNPSVPQSIPMNENNSSSSKNAVNGLAKQLHARFFLVGVGNVFDLFGACLGVPPIPSHKHTHFRRFFDLYYHKRNTTQPTVYTRLRFPPHAVFFTHSLLRFRFVTPIRIRLLHK